MIDPKLFEELASRIGRSLPPELGQLREDAERNMRAALSAALERMDLVTREELEVQAAVLARTREKLDHLEAQVRELESRLQGESPGSRGQAAEPGGDDRS